MTWRVTPVTIGKSFHGAADEDEDDEYSTEAAKLPIKYTEDLQGGMHYYLAVPVPSVFYKVRTLKACTANSDVMLFLSF